MSLCGGHRIADFIADTSLGEIKTGHALLAQNEGYDITDVVLYLARYQLVIRTPLQQLADDLNGGPADLHAARVALAHHDSPWQPNPRGRHHQGPIR